jgi:peptidoglycan/LPS O-acetylase OafA/YrhL
VIRGDTGTPRVLDRGDSPRFGYNAALDGLRALAVLAVIAYHDDYSWAKGGFLGVDTFFVLSGFLITTLLVVEFRRDSTIRLTRFWSRRARRLLPALLVVLALVALYTHTLVLPWNRPAIRADGLASFFYFANWRFIADKQGYFALFSAASPLRHTWSLAIEEQFYLVWPLVTYALLRASRGSLRILGAVCGGGVAASVAVMAMTYRASDPSRAYYGTDARAHTILMGALLAVLFALWTPSAKARKRLAVVAVGAFVAMLGTWQFATGTSSRYYHGGSAAYSVVACLVVAGAMQPGALHSILATRPLVWIGRLSYGLYLFHWPLDVLLVPSRVHMHGLALNALRLALTFAAATLSFVLIESPIRRGRRPALPFRARVPHTPRRNVVRWLALPAVGATLTVVVASGAGASAPPSYLTGSSRPSFAYPSAPTPGASAPSASKTSPGRHRAQSPPTRRTVLPTPAAAARELAAPTITPPKLDGPWGFGDPLFCGNPQPQEMREASEEARRLGPPDLVRPATNLRILVLGDSTACSLFPGLKAVDDGVGAATAQAAVFGCGIASGQITTTRGEQITPHSDRCPAMVAAAQIPAVGIMRPDVVIWMSLWEKSDTVADGRTLVSGTPAGDAEMLRRMDATLTRVTAYGAKVVLLTIAAPAPNDAQGTNNTSNGVDDAGYARLDHLDREFTRRHPGTVTLVDLARELCPNGPPCPEQVDGLRMRPDGRHFTPTAAAIEAHWLVPQIVAAARK